MKISKFEKNSEIVTHVIIIISNKSKKLLRKMIE